MKLQLFPKRVLALCLVCVLGMMLVSFPRSTMNTLANEKKTYVRETKKREQINFNRNWKFVRQDVEGAKATNFDDSSWVAVGLPHNFSIPYAMETKYYVGYGWYRKTFDIPAFRMI